jgi:biopolymer transport protein ExbB
LRAGEYGAPIALSLLVALCVAGLSVVRRKHNEQDEFMRHAAEAKSQFWSAGTMRQGAAALDAGSAFRYVAETALRAFEHNQNAAGSRIGGRVWVASVLRHASENVQGALQNGLANLGVIAMAAMVIGLLGALCGATIALNGVGPGGQFTFAQTTVAAVCALLSAILGSAIAIRAISARDRLAQRNSLFMNEVRNFCADLRTVLCAENVTRAPMPIAAGVQ